MRHAITKKISDRTAPILIESKHVLLCTSLLVILTYIKCLTAYLSRIPSQSKKTITFLEAAKYPSCVFDSPDLMSKVRQSLAPVADMASLPEELLENVFSHLPVTDLLMSSVCRRWNRIIANDRCVIYCSTYYHLYQYICFGLNVSNIKVL